MSRNTGNCRSAMSWIKQIKIVSSCSSVRCVHASQLIECNAMLKNNCFYTSINKMFYNEDLKKINNLCFGCFLFSCSSNCCCYVTETNTTTQKKMIFCQIESWTHELPVWALTEIRTSGSIAEIPNGKFALYLIYIYKVSMCT